MYLGLVPMLSRGSFALYYGGDLVGLELSEEVRGGSLVTPVFISGSVILQVVLSAFKLTQTSQLSPSANEGSLKLLSVNKLYDLVKFIGTFNVQLLQEI